MVDAGASPERVRWRVVVRGRVQGVWFRDSCAREARARGVAGWVCNLPDGSVEAAFEGTVAAVDELVAWCALGPPRARVEGCERWAEPAHGDEDFEVR